MITGRPFFRDFFSMSAIAVFCEAFQISKFVFTKLAIVFDHFDFGVLWSIVLGSAVHFDGHR